MNKPIKVLNNSVIFKYGNTLFQIRSINKFDTLDDKTEICVWLEEVPSKSKRKLKRF
jgi:hypothetical protein